MADYLSAPHTPSRLCAKIARAAALPYACSISIMSIGCPLGIPLRFPFDIVNIALLVSFMTSAVHLVRGNATAWHVLGFAQPQCTGSFPFTVWTTVKSTAWIVLPGLGAFVILTLGLSPVITALDNTIVTVASRITPMYMLGSMLAWQIAKTNDTTVS